MLSRSGNKLHLTLVIGVHHVVQCVCCVYVACSANVNDKLTCLQSLSNPCSGVEAELWDMMYSNMKSQILAQQSSC